MITIKIDVGKIDKSQLFKGQKATYLDCVLKDNKDGRDQYGYDGFVCQDVSKEKRDAGERGPIIGNWRRLGNSPAPRQPAKFRKPESADDEIPF